MDVYLQEEYSRTHFCTLKLWSSHVEFEVGYMWNWMCISQVEFVKIYGLQSHALPWKVSHISSGLSRSCLSAQLRMHVLTLKCLLIFIMPKTEEESKEVIVLIPRSTLYLKQLFLLRLSCFTKKKAGLVAEEWWEELEGLSCVQDIISNLES